MPTPSYVSLGRDAMRDPATAEEFDRLSGRLRKIMQGMDVSNPEKDLESGIDRTPRVRWVGVQDNPDVPPLTPVEPAIVFENYTQFQSTAGAVVEEVIARSVIPANTLVNDRDVLIIEGHGTFVDAARGKTLFLYYSGTDASLGFTETNVYPAATIQYRGPWTLRIRITKTGLAAQIIDSPLTSVRAITGTVTNQGDTRTTAFDMRQPIAVRMAVSTVAGAVLGEMTFLYWFAYKTTMA